MADERPAPPYKFRGAPPYVDELVREAGASGFDYRPAGATARDDRTLRTIASFVSAAAEHARRRTPEGVQAAARSLDHAERHVRVLEIALEAARRMVREARGHVKKTAAEVNMATHQGTPEGEPKPGSDPTANPKDPAATAADGSGPVPADREGKPIDLSVPPEEDANPEISDIGRLKEGKETFEQVQAENAAAPQSDAPAATGRKVGQEPPAEAAKDDGGGDRGGLGRAPKGKNK